MLITRIYRFFEKFFEIHPREFQLVQFAFSYATILSIFYILCATVGETLFLSHFDAKSLQELLPWIYISIALVSILVAWGYDRLNDIVPRRNLMIGAPLFFAMSILLFRYVIYVTNGHHAVYFGLVVWLEASALFMMALFFSYTGDLFSPRDARRLYGYIVIGMALGPLLGGILVVILLPYIAVVDFLYVLALTLLLGLLPAYRISVIATPYQLKVPKKSTHQPTLKALFSNKYIRLVFLIFFLSAMCNVVADYQMLSIAGQTLNEEEIADFFAKFFGYMGFLQLLIELFLARWLLQRFGVLKNLFTLPVLLLISGLSFLVHPNLFLAAAVNFVFLSMSDTLDLLSKELLFLPLSTRLRIRSQNLANGMLSAGGKILSGLILFLFALIQAPITIYAILLIVVVLIWIGTIIYLIPQYKSSLALSLSHTLFSADLKNALLDFRRLFNSKDNDDVLKNCLAISPPEKQIFLLNLLPDIAFKRLKSDLLKLTRSNNEQVVRLSLRFIAQQGDKEDRKLLQSFFDDARPQVQATAILAYSQLGQEESLPTIKPYMRSSHRPACVASIVGSFCYGSEQGRQLAEPYLVDLLKTDRISAAQVMSQITNIYDDWKFELNHLLLDKDENIRRAAIVACREAPDELFLPNLMLNLTENISLRLLIYDALCAMPAASIPKIKRLFYDPEQHEIARVFLLRSLGNIESPESIALILDVLIARPSQVLLITACQALQKILFEGKVRRESEFLIEECREKFHVTLLALRQAYQEMGNASPAIKQLFRDTIYFYSGIFFTLLGVQYGIKELAKITELLVGFDEIKVANNLELLEVVLPHKLFLRVIELVTPPIVGITFTRESVSQKKIDALLSMDEWVRCLALFYMKFKTGSENLKEILMSDQDKQLLERIDTIILLKQIELFSSIPANYLIGLAEIVHDEIFSAGEKIFNEGEVGDSMYLICSGQVSIRHGSKEIAQLGSGESIGEMAILDKLPRSATAVVLEETKLLRIDAKDFDDILVTHPEIAQCLLKILSLRLRKMISNTEIVQPRELSLND